MCTRSLACQGGECGYCRKAGHSPSNCPILAANDSILVGGRTMTACRAFIVAMAKTGAYSAECQEANCTRSHDQPWSQDQAKAYCKNQASRVGAKKERRSGKGPDDGGQSSALRWQC